MMKKLHDKIFEDNKKITTFVGVITIFIVIALLFSYEAGAILVSDASDELDKLRKKTRQIMDDGIKAEKRSLPYTGISNENTEYEEQFQIPQTALLFVNATLTWTDTAPEIGAGFLQENQPDQFSITIIAPSGETDSSGLKFNDASGSGIITASLMFDPLVQTTGDFTFIVEAGECGDVTGPGGMSTIATDSGNPWDLSIEYSYYGTMEEN